MITTTYAFTRRSATRTQGKSRTLVQSLLGTVQCYVRQRSYCHMNNENRSFYLIKSTYLLYHDVLAGRRATWHVGWKEWALDQTEENTWAQNSVWFPAFIVTPSHWRPALLTPFGFWYLARISQTGMMFVIPELGFCSKSKSIRIAKDIGWHIGRGSNSWRVFLWMLLRVLFLLPTFLAIAVFMSLPNATYETGGSLRGQKYSASVCVLSTSLRSSVPHGFIIAFFMWRLLLAFDADPAQGYSDKWPWRKWNESRLIVLSS